MGRGWPRSGAVADRGVEQPGRDKQGTKRSPLEPTLAGICDMIGPLPDRPCVHLDRDYDSRKIRDLLEILGYDDQIADEHPIEFIRTCDRLKGVHGVG